MSRHSAVQSAYAFRPHCQGIRPREVPVTKYPADRPKGDKEVRAKRQRRRAWRERTRGTPAHILSRLSSAWHPTGAASDLRAVLAEDGGAALPPPANRRRRRAVIQL